MYKIELVNYKINICIKLSIRILIIYNTTILAFAAIPPPNIVQNGVTLAFLPYTTISALHFLLT